jgi:Asp-tRNA(Asn)/Glu-tRNA(Gln) amidotransferase A subunit family amidase
MSVPCGFADVHGKKLPIGFHIMTQYRDEATMFGVARMVERGMEGK